MTDIEFYQTFVTLTELGEFQTFIDERKIFDYENLISMIFSFSNRQIEKDILNKRHRFDISEENFLNYVFIHCCEYNKHLVVKKILFKIDPHFDNDYAIRYAVKNNHHRIVEILLKYVIYPNNLSECVSIAAVYGRKKILKMLLVHGFKCEIKDTYKGEIKKIMLDHH